MVGGGRGWRGGGVKGWRGGGMERFKTTHVHYLDACGGSSLSTVHMQYYYLGQFVFI